MIPVLGDYLEDAGVARHNTARVARDLMQLVEQQVPAKRTSKSGSAS